MSKEKKQYRDRGYSRRRIGTEVVPEGLRVRSRQESTVLKPAFDHFDSRLDYKKARRDDAGDGKAHARQASTRYIRRGRPGPPKIPISSGGGLAWLWGQ